MIKDMAPFSNSIKNQFMSEVFCYQIIISLLFPSQKKGRTFVLLSYY